jgi:hypothetical protein
MQFISFGVHDFLSNIKRVQRQQTFKISFHKGVEDIFLQTLVLILVMQTISGSMLVNSKFSLLKLFGLSNDDNIFKDCPVVSISRTWMLKLFVYKFLFIEVFVVVKYRES